MGFLFAPRAALRFAHFAVFFAMVGGCTATVPGGLGQNSTPSNSNDATRIAPEVAPRHPSASVETPVIGVQGPTLSDVVTVDHRFPTGQPELAQAELPQPKLLPVEAKDQNPHLLKTVEPTLTLDLTVGLSKILQFKEAPKRVQMDTEEKAGIADR